MQLEVLVREWVDRANQDAAAAQYLLTMRPRPIEIIGFHTQQAAEKCLKAVIVRAGIMPPRTHDLVYIYRMCQRQTRFESDYTELCARLTPYAVEHRYPSESNIDENELLADFEATLSLCKTVRDHLGI